MSSPDRSYAAIPSQNEHSRPPTPASSADVRSAAIAKLKRAASLPRTPAGRRAVHNASDTPSAPNTPHDAAGPSMTPVYASIASPAALAVEDGQEMLSPSPTAEHFDPSIYNFPPAAMSMQRSASASSSFHMATPPITGYPHGSPYFAASPSNDWAAMQLAQSYLPSLSPAGLTTPNFASPIGRNTPSPLPTLGELGALQRSNSAAARAHAMSKLTGASGTSTPTGGPSRPGLQRADSLGASRVFGMAKADVPETPSPAKDAPASSIGDARPRLQRSFTVSSSNMGEERRSAVGRRMVMRLGERRVARQQEEQEVRRLWEERRAANDSHDDQDDEQLGQDDIRLESGQEESSQNGDGYPEEQFEEDRDSTPAIPVVEKTSPPEEHTARFADPVVSAQEELLGAPDRPTSRGTMRSAEEAFEYEAHLRRSLSSRTARGAMGTVQEAVPTVDQGLDTTSEELHDGMDHEQQDQVLPLPQPAYATPTRHTANASTSTQGTIQGGQSPGESVISRDGLGSMMFVMGGGSGPNPLGQAPQGEHHFPIEVGDNSGSDWGTPARDQHVPTFSDSPAFHSPLANMSSPYMPQSGEEHSSRERTSPEYTPGASARTSVMSWEEVGGPEDQAVPSDNHYRKKSGSISAKLGRNIRTAMRKRSQSRSSVTSSNDGNPTSPRSLSIAIREFSRRGSESSASPSQSAIRASPNLLQGTPDHVKHQPSVSSLAPSVAQPESSANSMLLQHQMTSNPPPTSWLPRAELSDPRIHSSKLSPFPGMANLERKAIGDTMETPKLVHQVSDSVVPSQQRVTPGHIGGDSIYALPLQRASGDAPRRTSTDSVNKKSWLSKTFGSSTSLKNDGLSRQSSTSSTPNNHSRNGSTDRSPTITVESDPFAGPPPPTLLKPTKHRSASPSVSVVPELSEDGSRLTRFIALSNGRTETASPLAEEVKPEQVAPAKDTSLPQKSIDVLNRMDALLAMGPDDPARPDILDDPPRKLLLATQVLQVVNVHTAKDRFLFLFNDLLVISKPLISHGTAATLDMKFLVKSVVPLDKLKVTGLEEEPKEDPPRHAVVQRFIEQFAEEPVSACKYLVERSNPRVDPDTLASLIFKTPELDREQIGNLLAGNDRLMKAFIDRFHFAGIRIDNALRMFLLSLRLPSESTAAESLLRGFAHRYFQSNSQTLSFTREMTEELVLWIMQLNDTLYGMYGFALPNHAVTPEVFASAFQSKDPRGLVDPALLSDIYDSVKIAKLDQALTSEQEKTFGQKVTMKPARVPSKLTYQVWSEWISVNIPRADAEFGIRLVGEGLVFEPHVLDFADSRTARFRVKGTSLGSKSILFERFGHNSALYASIGNTRMVSVERAFMQHTFHAAFTSHTGSKRKYCFSVTDAAVRGKWASHLLKQIDATAVSKAKSRNNERELIRNAAEVVSLQVLRDALIPPEPKDDHSGTLGRSARAGSVSVAYGETQGKGESDLGPLVAGRPTQSSEQQGGIIGIQTGKELVLLCRQNSLLPGVLELLQAGLPTPPPSAAPAHARGKGSISGLNGQGRGHERTLSRKDVGGRV